MVVYESEDKRIRVEEKNGQKAMFLDGVIQGVCDLEGNPLSPYMVFVKKHLDSLSPKSYTTFLGGGAFILPSYSHKLDHTVECYEIDYRMISASNNYIAQLSFVPTIADADLFDHSRQYQTNFIFLDCWDKGFPDKLYNKDFITRCKTALTHKGVFACNLGGTAVEIEAFGKMLATVFANVKVNLIAMDQNFKGPLQGVFFCAD